MKLLRNVVIILLIAIAVAFLPGGHHGANVVLTALTMGFLAALAWFVFQLRRQNDLTVAALSDGRRALLYGALGMIALLIAGTSKFFSSSGGTLAWIVLLGASIAAIWRVWLEANTY